MRHICGLGLLLLVGITLATPLDRGPGLKRGEVQEGLLADLKHLRRSGLLVGHPGTPRWHARVQMAVAIHATAYYFEASSRALLQLERGLPLEVNYNPATANQMRPELGRLARLAYAFEKDLASFGASRQAVLQSLQATAKNLASLNPHSSAVEHDLPDESFPDVPPHHWAATALAELKSVGLLKGYPNGYFQKSE